MRKLAILAATASSVAFLCAAVPAAAQTQTTVICTEDANGGCVQQLPATGSTIIAASDGEGTFNPFNFAGGDTSDGLNLDSIWTVVSAPGWVQIPGTNTFVVPSCDANGVCENGNVEEAVGHWIAHGFTLTVPTQIYQILDPGGNSVSDVITLYNDATGTVNILFNSSVPEPATWGMMLLGVGAIGAMARRRARVALAA